MAKRRLNKRVVIGLALFAFLSMIVLSVLMLQQLQRGDPQRFVELARQYESEGEWRPAAQFYHKAWERSGDWTHIVSQGDMLLEEGEVALALRSWRQALVQQPGLIGAHKRQLETLLELARLHGHVESWIMVQEAAQAMLKVDASPAELGFAHHANGMALIRTESQAAENAEKGLAELQEAVRLAGNVAEYAITLASQRILHDQVDEGEKLFAALLERHSNPGVDASKVRSAYAGHLAARGEVEQAQRYLTESVALAEGDFAALLEARLAYAQFLAQQWARSIVDKSEGAESDSLFTKAEAILQRCVEADPEAFVPHVRLATLYKTARRHSDVVDVCEHRLLKGFSRKGLRATRDKLNTFHLMILASEGCVGMAVEASAADDKPRREDWLSRAQQHLNDADAEYPDHPAVLAQSGRIILARGRERDALEFLREADETYRSYDVVDWENKLRLATLHLKLNEPGAAKAVLDEALAWQRAQAGTSFWTLYAQVLLRSAEVGGKIDHNAVGDIERALAQVALRDPDNASIRRLRVALLERVGRPEQAVHLAESPTVRALLEARERSQNGDIDGAIEVVREALEDDPGDLRLVGTVVNELLSLHRTDEARAIVERALRAKPDHTFLQKLAVLTREALSAEDRDQAMLAVIEAEEDAYQRCWDLIDFYRRRGELTKALTYFDEAEQHLIDQDTPHARNATKAQHRALLQAKLVVAARLEDQAAMAAVRDSAAKHNVDGTGGKSILGLYHMYRNEMDVAIIAFTAAAEAQPTDPRSLAHLGQCLMSVGRTDEARDYFERALRMNPSEGVAHKGLAAIGKGRGDLETYEKHLAACKRLFPGDSWVQQELLEHRERDDPRQAIVDREARLDDNPDDPVNLERLAVLSERIGDLEKADDYYGRLLKLRRDERGLIVVVAKYYRRTGRPESSLKVVTRYAQSKDPGPDRANALILVAAHHLSEENPGQVEATLLRAADMAETFEVCHALGNFYFQTGNQPKEALRWLDRAVGLAGRQAPAKLAQVIGARIGCLLHRAINDLEQAREHVDEFMADFPDDPRGFLWSSEVDARMGKIEGAVEALTRYLAKRPNDPYALFQRAQHYGALGRTSAAIDDLTRIKRVSPTALKLEPRRQLARLRFHAGRRDTWIEELESIVEDAPQSAAAVEELVGAYIYEGRLVEADRIITSRINRGGAEPDARWLLLRGRVSLELGKVDDALRDIHRGAEISNLDAESFANVLTVYVEVKRFADGVEYYEKHASPANRTPASVSRYGRLLAAAGRKLQAVDAFRDAMNPALSRSIPASGTVISNVRGAFPTDEALREAVELFESNLPGGAEGRANDRILARLYRLIGRGEDARKKLDQLLRTADNDRERTGLIIEKAESYQVAGEPELAVAAYEQALAYDPDNWAVLNNVAYLRSDELGEYEQALSYARRAVALADVPATLDTLGWIYVGIEEYPLAIAELSRSVRLDPGDPLSYYHLGEAYRRNKQFIEAGAILERGREVARTTGDESLLERIERASEKVSRRDSAP